MSTAGSDSMCSPEQGKEERADFHQLLKGISCNSSPWKAEDGDGIGSQQVALCFSSQHRGSAPTWVSESLGSVFGVGFSKIRSLKSCSCKAGKVGQGV